MMKSLAFVLAVASAAAAATARVTDVRLGLVGTDTSHVLDFATDFNDPASSNHVAGARIVAAFKGGSPDLPASRDRIERFTTTLQEKYGVEIVDNNAE